jgi:RNA methyltransferase, TrmH family
MGRAEHDRTVRFRTARRDRDLTVIEGFHALKHALRFGAELVEAYAVDPAQLEALAAELAPDLAGELAGRVEPIAAAALAELAPLVPRTGVVAIARRPAVDLAAVLADPRPAPVVLLEQPKNMGNIGACIRVAAAADAAAVLTTGENDPWYPDAVRGAAGLHFALPVTAIEELPASDRPLLAIDPEGEDLHPERLPPRAVLAFGTERHGISAELLARADARVAIPMRDGVSSLNLATSVAVTLFCGRLAPGGVGLPSGRAED